MCARPLARETAVLRRSNSGYHPCTKAPKSLPRASNTLDEILTFLFLHWLQAHTPQIVGLKHLPRDPPRLSPLHSIPDFMSFWRVLSAARRRTNPQEARSIQRPTSLLLKAAGRRAPSAAKAGNKAESCRSPAQGSPKKILASCQYLAQGGSSSPRAGANERQETVAARSCSCLLWVENLTLYKPCAVILGRVELNVLRSNGVAVPSRAAQAETHASCQQNLIGKRFLRLPRTQRILPV